MTLFERLGHWKDSGRISAEQHLAFSALARQNPFSIFLELNGLLYLGVLSFVAGLGWTIQTYFHQLGDAAILIGLTGLLIGCLSYCFARASPFSAAAVESPTLILDYVLYLGCLSWSVELAYLETRYHFMSGQWNAYLLLSALFFFTMACRFDNRFVLTTGLSALAAWFGVGVSRFGLLRETSFGSWGIPYGLLVIAIGAGLRKAGIKAHFFTTFLHVAVNAIFIAILSGVFANRGTFLWTTLLIIAAVTSLVYGLQAKQFAFVAYAAVYGYIGISSILLREFHDTTFTLLYLVVSGAIMTGLIIFLARHFGKEA